jgi:hypothetical protein
VTVPRYSDVSVNIAMYTLYNNIVSDIFFHSDICVDFLGTHMASLVLFYRKPGVTAPAAASTKARPSTAALSAAPRPPLAMAEEC